MRISRFPWVAWFALTLACTSRPLSPMASSGGSESDGGSTGGGSTESGPESESETETGDPMQTCATEWDCGVGERCLDGACVCVGCECGSPNVGPATIDAPDPDEVPTFFDVSPMECEEDADCEPLEFCSGGACIESTACVEDLDCYTDWWPSQDRFCVDGLCQWLGCDYELEGDAGCPEGSICDGGCSWLAMVPTCADVPSFQEVAVHTLDAPDSATVVILDVDLDERDDLVVLEDGFVYWLTSTGEGFSAPTPWRVEPGTQIVAIASADVQGDGVDELLVSHAEPLGVELLAAGASWPQWIGFAETTTVPAAARMLDVDYDGLPDIVTGTSVIGPMTLVEARLGDGTGTFGPLWTEEVDPFEFSQPAPHLDDEFVCTRALGSIEPEKLGARRLDHEGVNGGHAQVVRRNTAGHTFFPETPQHPAGFLATAATTDGGVLFFAGPGRVGLSPTPGAVALLSRDVGIQHALVDHGVEPAEFVELEGSPFAALCRGGLGFALDSSALAVGDFDGDGREDLLTRDTNGVLHAWLSRD